MFRSELENRYVFPVEEKAVDAALGAEIQRLAPSPCRSWRHREGLDLFPRRSSAHP